MAGAARRDGAGRASRRRSRPASGGGASRRRRRSPGHVRGRPLGGRLRAVGGATRCSAASRSPTACAGRPATTPRRRCTAATASSTTRRSPPTTSPRRPASKVAGARRRLPPRQRHPADLLRARRRRSSCRCTATRSRAYPYVTGYADETGAGPGRVARRQRPAPAGDRRRRLPRRARLGAATRSTRSTRRCWSSRSASTRTSATRSATSRSRPRLRALRRGGRRPRRAAVVLQEGGYADDALGDERRALAARRVGRRRLTQPCGRSRPRPLRRP